MPCRSYATFLILRVLRYILPLFAPHKKYWSNPQRAARVATKVLINAPGETGIYYDDGGQPMLGSTIARDPRFADRTVAETRALLATILSWRGHFEHGNTNR